MRVNKAAHARSLSFSRRTFAYQFVGAPGNMKRVRRPLVGYADTCA